MPKPTQGEIIHELTKSVAAMTQSQNDIVQAVAELRPLRERVAVLEQQVVDLKGLKEDLAVVAELKTKVALLERETQELKHQWEEAGKKRWALLPPVLGAVVNVLLAALVAYFVSRR